MRIPANEQAMPKEVGEAWIEFLEHEDRRAAGLDLYEDIFQHPWLFPLQRKAEMAGMQKLARSINPRVVMEIGSDKGGSFYHWVKGQPSVETAIAIEIRGVPFAKPMNEAFPYIDFRCIDDSSYDPTIVAEVQKFLDGQPIDVLFIDGDKGAVSKDFEAYLPLIAHGGLVLFHDIVDPIEPQRFFYSLRNRFRLGCIIDGREGALAGLATGEPKSAWEGWLRIWQANSCGVGIVYL